MTLTEDQYIGYCEIELRIIMQRAIEILDEFKRLKYKSKNQTLQAGLKAIYPSLDKETKKYNDIFDKSEEGTSHFYNVVTANASLVMSDHLLNKAIINAALAAHELNPKAVEGIINKIILEKFPHKRL